MPNHELDHECDLFLFSSHSSYLVNRSLQKFAELGQRNINGWGIGYYNEGEYRLIKSKRPASDNGRISDEFITASKLIESHVVIGHLRLTSAGDNRVENNHPFYLRFLNYDWLFVHNGTARNQNLVPYDQQLILNSTNDSPRVFEFIRTKILDYLGEKPSRSLIEAVRYAFSSLLEADPNGKFNIILTNGHLSFALIHWRSFYLYTNEKEGGNTIRLSTLKIGASHQTNDPPYEFKPLPNKLAKMLVFNGDSLIFNGDIPKIFYGDIPK